MKGSSRSRRPKTVNKNIRNDIVFPNVYQRNYKATPMTFHEDTRTQLNSTNTVPILSVRPSSVQISSVARRREVNERKEILEWLENENPDPITLLNRLAETSSPYSKLFKMTAEELSHVFAKTKSRCLTQLEQDSGIEAASVETSVHDETQRLKNNTEAKKQLAKEVEKKVAELDKINKDITILETLISKHEIDKLKPEQSKEVILIDDYKEEKKEPFNETLYSRLWTQQMMIQQEIDSLEAHLSEIQRKQMEAMKEKATEMVQRKNTNMYRIIS